MLTNILLVVVIAGIGVIGYVQFTKKDIGTNHEEEQRLREDAARMKAELEQKQKELGKLEKSLSTEQAEKNELSGKNKTQWAQHESLKGDFKTLAVENDTLKKRLSGYEEQETRREKEIERKMTQLEKAEMSLKEERERVIREEEEQRRLELEARDRIWADHENGVVSLLTDLCKHPALSFTAYTNTNLPEGFDGSLKPDFLIDFLGQYIVFDAKVSKAKSLKAYIDDQVKRTVEKVKIDERIHKWIFLVVPTSALPELKQHTYAVEGYQLFVVGQEALPAILACLKHITRYEFAEQMDPQQRENIIQMVADFDFHINLRNAADIVLTKMGIATLERAQKLDPELAEEVLLKKQPMNAKAAIAAGEIKKIVTQLTAQNMEIDALVAPKASVKKQQLKAAEEAMTEALF